MNKNMPKQKVALLTAGGLAPCLSSAIGLLLERYTELSPDTEIIGYLGGYKGLLLGESLAVTPQGRAKPAIPTKHCASPLGHTRVKPTNLPHSLTREPRTPPHTPP